MSQSSWERANELDGRLDAIQRERRINAMGMLAELFERHPFLCEIELEWGPSQHAGSSGKPMNQSSGRIRVEGKQGWDLGLVVRLITKDESIHPTMLSSAPQIMREAGLETLPHESIIAAQVDLMRASDLLFEANGKKLLPRGKCSLEEGESITALALARLLGWGALAAEMEASALDKEMGKPSNGSSRRGPGQL